MEHGSEVSFAEDTLFLAQCLNKKLKIYAVPEYIAELKDERPSTWFKGYTDKHFMDQGIVYYCLSKKLAKLLCLQDSIRHRKEYSIYGNVKSVYKKMIEGVKKIKTQMEEF